MTADNHQNNPYYLEPKPCPTCGTFCGDTGPTCAEVAAEQWREHPAMGYSICLPNGEYIDLSLTVCKFGDRDEREHELRNYIVACVNHYKAKVE